MKRDHEAGTGRSDARDAQGAATFPFDKLRALSLPKRLSPSKTTREAPLLPGGRASLQPPFRKSGLLRSAGGSATGMSPLLGLLGLIALLLPAMAFGVGAGASAERKQQELEAALVASASAVKADLTKLQCGNLVYASNKSSVCFADKFLADVAHETHLDAGRSFVAVRLRFQ